MPCIRILKDYSRVLVWVLVGVIGFTGQGYAEAAPEGLPLVVTANERQVIAVISKRNPFANTLYDASIKRWAVIYTPQHPWYWNKAQLIAESALQADAVSSAGAMGLGQFMPKTWEQMERELGFFGSPFDTGLNIQAHAYYMSKLIGQFKKDRPYEDKYSLALASYNAGLGNVLKAQAKAGGSLLYAPMISQLHLITGTKNTHETTTYVIRIWSYIDILAKLEESK